MIEKLSPLALAMCLAGCMSLAPKYERPAAPVAAAFPDAPAIAGEAASAIGWKRYFADARLQRLIELALANNRDLRIAVANVEQARAQFRVRRADQAPTVALGVQGNRSADKDEEISSSYTGGLQVSAFELDLFGRVRNLSAAAQAQFFASEENRRAAQVSLIASVANAYLATLADEELLDLTRRTLSGREESLKLIQLKFDNGVVSRIDLQQANALVESARVVLAQQQRQRAASLNLLTLLVGQPPPEGMPAAARLADTALAELPAGLPSDLLAVRPDVRAAEQQLIGANANIGAARAAYFPRITLTAGIGSASDQLGDLFKGGSWGWSLAPQMLLPIFDMGRREAGVDGAKAARDAALAQYERAIQMAFREVADGLAGQATYGEQLRAQRAVAAAEQERYNLADLRYRNGAASYLDLLDAQRSLFAAQQAAVQANLARLQNQVTLYRVLGGN
jgi:NodT family efflux transporter outer membrane factor (OMF) lipoprotein